MHTNTRVHTRLRKPKTSRRGQPVWAYLLLLPLVLFTLSSCISTPDTAQTPGLPIAMTLPVSGQQRNFQMSALLHASAADGGCTDAMRVDQASLQEIRIYLNDCMLLHLAAIVADANLVAAFITLICPDCAPLAAWITAVVATFTANIAHLEYTSQRCGGGGAILDVSWEEGWQFKPVCQDQ
jgi:hypothetical protein